MSHDPVMAECHDLIDSYLSKLSKGSLPFVPIIPTMKNLLAQRILEKHELIFISETYTKASVSITALGMQVIEMGGIQEYLAEYDHLHIIEQDKSHVKKRKVEYVNSHIHRRQNLLLKVTGILFIVSLALGASAVIFNNRANMNKGSATARKSSLPFEKQK